MLTQQGSTSYLIFSLRYQVRRPSDSIAPYLRMFQLPKEAAMFQLRVTLQHILGADAGADDLTSANSPVGGIVDHETREAEECVLMDVGAG